MAVGLCFVCAGNICRSPSAEGIFRHLAKERGVLDRFDVDSAGTGNWHVGEAPDIRARDAARARGIALEGVARRFEPVDFARFDYVLAMDHENRDDLRRLAPSDNDLPKILVNANNKPLLTEKSLWTAADIDNDKHDDLLILSPDGQLTAVLNPKPEEKKP